MKIGLSYPSKWDKDWGGGMFIYETPGRSGIWQDMKVLINQSYKDIDYFVVYEDINEYLFIPIGLPKERCILITGEIETVWDYSVEFLNQFGHIITSRKDITHPNIHYTQYICPWHVKKDYDYLMNVEIPKKSHNLSSVTSNAFKLDGHQRRFRLVNRLKGHFKNELYLFGRGENYINDKWDALFPYRFSIAIENSVSENYWTEKIADCFLSFTMPIYYGCPNIENFFDKESLIKIDIDDFEKSISIIEDAICRGIDRKNFEALNYSRNKYLNSYTLFPILYNTITDLEKSSFSKNGKTLIKGKSYFLKTSTIKQRLYKNYKISQYLFDGYR